ncbi:hypothetical protein H5410_012419 [Solanum commersonii]|uniref:Uncharacterized protein n=1 Tax=Solanum commersonii TaxID=4109 RepID=A0A9J6ASB3_SOLCO|nr:hypothetical protein H5410_012419 [Solanum commersonii]
MHTAQSSMPMSQARLIPMTPPLNSQLLLTRNHERSLPFINMRLKILYTYKGRQFGDGLGGRKAWGGGGGGLAGKMSFIGCGHFSLRVGLVEKYGPKAEILVKHIKIAL